MCHACTKNELMLQCTRMEFTLVILTRFSLVPPTPWTMSCLKLSTLASEFGTSKLTLPFAPTTVNMQCNVLAFGRIVMSLFPRIRIISAFIAL